MIKIITIIGARPQFIKAGVISREIKENYKNIVNEVIIHTGQHYDHDMSDIFFEEMQIPTPKYNLNVGGSKLHGQMTGLMIIELEKILIQENPDYVLVYGDTNSTLAGAIAASKLHFPIVHIEAGLRSFNKKMPEEINRIITDSISDYLFTPSKISTDQLKSENINKNVYEVGDIMLDAIRFYANQNYKPKLNLPDRFLLATIHRQENTDNKERLTELFLALSDISKEIPILLPLHPRTKSFIEKFKIDISPNISLLQPLGYKDMIYLIQKSNLVLTDSGGLQKESYYLDKPIVILRDETEWVELVETGVAELAGANYNKIVNSYASLSKIKDKFTHGIYGAGDTSKQILEILVRNHIRS